MLVLDVEIKSEMSPTRSFFLKDKKLSILGKKGYGSLSLEGASRSKTKC